MIGWPVLSPCFLLKVRNHILTTVVQVLGLWRYCLWTAAAGSPPSPSSQATLVSPTHHTVSLASYTRNNGTQIVQFSAHLIITVCAVVETSPLHFQMIHTVTALCVTKCNIQICKLKPVSCILCTYIPDEGNSHLVWFMFPQAS